jgi:hypothetical protein
VHWVIGGAGADAAVALEYRKAADAEWHKGMPLFRVEAGKHLADKYGSKTDVPDGATLFAGSAVDLSEDTAYELRLTLTNGGGAAPVVKTLAAHTRGEPFAAKDAPVRYVVPAPDRAQAAAPAGDGTKEHPFVGLAAAQAGARPGDVMLLGPGVYAGTFEVKKNGEEGRPIVYRGQDAATVILDGQAGAAKRPGKVVGAYDAHDVWFENLSVRNGNWGVTLNDGARIVVRGCRVSGCDYAIAATNNNQDHCRDLFIADNVLEGPSTWPRTKGIENARGVQVTGAGHVVCYNRIKNFADAIDTFNSPRCESIDYYNNEISEMTDDGCELDYSTRNVRCFDNRFTNCYQGISVQPVFGGPVYAYRNALYDVVMEPYKVHNSPSGALFFHNTVVKKGPPMLVYTEEPASHVVMRNNLFVGTGGRYAWECSPKMTNCDLDYDGFSSGDYKMFLKWNDVRYATFDEMRGKAPIERHATLVDAAKLFATGALPPADPKTAAAIQDLRLADKSDAVDAGVALPGFNDGFAGKAPDLGAYESGRALPHYGPRK